jgi:hypothetical protein
MAVIHPMASATKRIGTSQSNTVRLRGQRRLKSG